MIKLKELCIHRYKMTTKEFEEYVNHTLNSYMKGNNIGDNDVISVFFKKGKTRKNKRNKCFYIYLVYKTE